MGNPKITAAICGVAALLIAFRMFTATEAPSGALDALNWVFLLLALFGFVGSLITLARGTKE